MAVPFRLPMLLVLLGCIIFGVVGCARPPAPAIQVQAVLEAMDTARASVRTVHTHVRLRSGSELRGTWLGAELWLKLSQPSSAVPVLRVLVKESDNPSTVGTVLVSDGNTVWLYSPADNIAITGAYSELGGRASQVVAGGANLRMLQALFTLSLRDLQVQVEAEELIEGVPTWRLLITPPPGRTAPEPFAGLTRAQLWVDRGRSLPVRARLDLGGPRDIQVELSHLETNLDLPASLFTFSPPADVEVLRPERPAATVTPAPMPFKPLIAAQLPPGMQLVQQERRGDGRLVQTYQGEGQTVTLVQSAGPIDTAGAPPVGSTTTSVTVRGHDATLIVDPSATSSYLAWQEPDRHCVLAGTVDAATIQRIAQHLAPAEMEQP